MDVTVLHRMVEALYHRGPDASGYYRTDGFQAGMRRLRINDLETGDQPLFNADRSVALLYNGEIYNYPVLRKKLERLGYRFRTNSDGEVICHLYDAHGEDLFEHLDGMFAVALWVEREKKLILARDIPGEKPLYYAKLSETEIVFASEIKSIILFPDLDLELDYQALWDFPTFLWIPEPATVYKNVTALQRNHLLVADRTGIRIRAYRNRFKDSHVPLDTADVVEKTRRTITEVIESRLLSDVPVGAYLSSGLDSSIIAAVASRALPKLSTFTLGFENMADPYHGMSDESKEAEEYARYLGTDHRTIHVTAEDFRDHLIKFCIHGDQPFSVSSGIGILMIAKAAQEEGIKVLLSGDGADECFGGYSWYFHLNDSIPGTMGEEVKEGEVTFQNFGLPIEKRLTILGTYPPQERAWAWHYYASEDEKVRLFNPDIFGSVDSSLRHFYAFKPDADWRPEDFIQQDREFYFPYEMLRKIDRMTMAFSVEGRSPFAAPSVLALADTLEYPQLIRDRQLKWILRQAFSSDLPGSVIHRPKHGFNVPIDHWLKNDWSEMLLEAFSENSQLMKLGLIQKKGGAVVQRMLCDPERLNGHTLFSFIMLNLWLEHVHGNHC